MRRPKASSANCTSKPYKTGFVGGSGRQAAQFASQSCMAAERLRKIKTEMTYSAEPIRQVSNVMRLEQELSKKNPS